MSAERSGRDAPPRLLHVFSTFAAAGPQVRTAELLRAFGGEFEHAILPLDGTDEAFGLIPPELGVRHLEPPPRAGTLRTARALAALLRRERPDLLLTYNWGAIDAVLAARRVGLRAVLHHEDGFRPDEAQDLKLRRSLWRRLVLPGAHRVIVISRNLERIARESWHLPQELVAFVPNGIDADSFQAADGSPALRASLGIPAGAVVVGAVGHLRPEKNLPRLLAAAAPHAERHDLHLLILGEGPERGAVERAAATPGLEGRVHLVGHHADPREHYRAMDVFAISSDTEQMPIALLEAMASGLPAVGTDVGDVRSVLPESQRAQVTPLSGGAEAMGRALEGLAADRSLRARLGASNRDHVRAHFTREGMIRAYRELYRSALRA